MADNKKKKLAIAVGTRPEAIKLAPLYLEAKKSNLLEPYILATGQHNQMLLDTLSAFDIKPEINLEVMIPGQTLSYLTASIVQKAESFFKESSPDYLIVQGDTTTALTMALSGFYHKIPVGHVEAGLRTATKYSPYPEELNRRVVTQIANHHFAPTEWAYNNLKKEGISEDEILLTGNTVIDALEWTVKKVRSSPPEFSVELNQKISSENRIVLITGHRRENFGKGFEDLCLAIRTLAVRNSNVEFIYPVHLNPNVQEPVKRILSDIPNVLLIDPLEYVPFVYLMDKCFFIISDSGGIQEEAPHLGKPVLVMRESTERPEAIEAGTAKLVGTNPENICMNAQALLDDNNIYQEMSRANNPYGNGTSCLKIVRYIEEYFLRETSSKYKTAL